jgi:hypothetical protein
MAVEYHLLYFKSSVDSHKQTNFFYEFVCHVYKYIVHFFSSSFFPYLTFLLTSGKKGKTRKIIKKSKGRLLSFFIVIVLFFLEINNKEKEYDRKTRFVC